MRICIENGLRCSHPGFEAEEIIDSEPCVACLWSTKEFLYDELGLISSLLKAKMNRR